MCVCDRCQGSTVSRLLERAVFIHQKDYIGVYVHINLHTV